jgi:urea transporter
MNQWIQILNVGRDICSSLAEQTCFKIINVGKNICIPNVSNCFKINNVRRPTEPTWDVGIQTTGANQTFSVNIFSGTSPNITVDWGDGTVETFTTTGVKTRTYASAGSYTVKISGSFASGGNIRLGDTTAERARVQSTSVIPMIPGLTSFTQTFRDCTSLTSIPAGLFANNTAVTNFGDTFRNCTSLTSIPAGLFDNNTAVTSFTGTFIDCSSLTSIPAGLFASNTAVISFTSTFINCSSLTSIPAGLFASNTAVISFAGTFDSCSSLTSIPSGLFDNNTAVANFAFTFFNCTSLTSVPAGLFASNTAVISFAGTFDSCSSLTSIPSGLFDNNTAVANFAFTFFNCTSLTSVPAGLFANNTAVTNFAGTFDSCSSLTSIPSGLFDNNTAVANFAFTFRNCTSLTSVPAGLFANNTAVTNFENVFFGASLTTTSYSDLLINMASNAASRQNNVIFGGGNSKYNVDGQTARNTFIAKGWTFNDGGLEIEQAFSVTNSGSSAYIVDGLSNPTLTLTRGRTYQFIINALNHPFWIKTSATTGTGNVYNQGVNNNGITNGTITFTVPLDAPNTLFYICQFHSSMGGTINIVN